VLRSEMTVHTLTSTNPTSLSELASGDISRFLSTLSLQNDLGDRESDEISTSQRFDLSAVRHRYSCVAETVDDQAFHDLRMADGQ